MVAAPIQLSLSGLAGAFGFLALQSPLAAHVHLDLFGLSIGSFGDRDLQHALFIVRLDLVGVSGRRQRKRARKTSILPLDAAEVFFPFFPFEFPHATHGEYIILDPDIDVLLFNARNFDFQSDIVVVFVDTSKQAIHLIVQRSEFGQTDPNERATFSISFQPVVLATLDSGSGLSGL